MTSTNVIYLSHGTGVSSSGTPVPPQKLLHHSQTAGGSALPQAARLFSFPRPKPSPLGLVQSPAGSPPCATPAGQSFDGPIMRTFMRVLLAVFVGLVLAVSVTHWLPKAAGQIHFDKNGSPPYMTGW